MRKRNAVIIFIGFLLVFFASSISAQENIPIPALSFQVGGSAVSSDGSVPATLKLIIFITLLSFGPAIILTTTCFTRIAIVLGLVRTTLGTASTPPNTVLAGLALFLTVSIMQPVFTKMYAEGIRPYLDGQMADEEAYKKTISPLQTFLVHHARDKDLALFLEITKSPIPESPKDVPFIVAVPAFVLSELNLAFQIAFLIAVPFLILDMVVSSVLTSMSMITLPPVVISLPLKLMLFVLVDGWHLIVSSLVKTYSTGG